MFHCMLYPIRSHGSVVRALRFVSKRLPVLIQTTARQPFSNLRKSNPLFPVAMMASLPEPDVFLQPQCANESFFAKPVQKFTAAYNFLGGAD